jgi:hypothetical protein
MEEENLRSGRKILEALGYKINERKFSDIKKFFSEDYIRVNPDYPEDYVVYSGAEHLGNPKLPNITLLPNIPISVGNIIGSTMGHQHIQYKKDDTRRFQEIYEFMGYGGMLLRNEEKTILYVLKPKDKIMVGTKDNMTIFNMDKSPLITLDYANPERNSANKDLEGKIGPLILIKTNAEGIVFKTNKEYYDRGLINGEFNPMRIENMSLGEEIYKKISDYEDKFKERGINLILGGNIPTDLRKDFSLDLLNLVLTKNKTLLDELGIKS